MLNATILLSAISLFGVAAYGDIKALQIPNILVAAIAVIGVIRLLQIGDLTTALYTVGMAVLLFVVSVLLFTRGLIGGGDVKLLAATILLLSYQDVFPFLVIMSLFGALVSISMLIIRHFTPSKSETRLMVPYGVAIAAAGTVTLVSQSSLLG